MAEERQLESLRAISNHQRAAGARRVLQVTYRGCGRREICKIDRVAPGKPGDGAAEVKGVTKLQGTGGARTERDVCRRGRLEIEDAGAVDLGDTISAYFPLDNDAASIGPEHARIRDRTCDVQAAAAGGFEHA